MRKKIGIIIVLAMILGGMLYLRSRGSDQPAEAAPNETTPTEDSGDTMKDNIPLGTVIPNETDGGVIITAAQADGTEKQFIYTDVAADSWYLTAVNYAVSSGLISGEGNLLQPEYGVQRAQFAAVLYRYSGGEPVDQSCSFSDVDPQEWYVPYIDWVVSKGYMGGLDAETFAPFSYMTVEQAIVTLYRLAGEPYEDGTLADYPYTPKITEAAMDAMTWAWNKGLIAEEECVWYPTQALSRAQMAVLLLRFHTMTE